MAAVTVAALNLMTSLTMRHRRLSETTNYLLALGIAKPIE